MKLIKIFKIHKAPKAIGVRNIHKRRYNNIVKEGYAVNVRDKNPFSLMAVVRIKK